MPTVVLDISRSISRIGKGRQTGIDRVEIAYIRHFLKGPRNVFFLARYNRSSVLLDRAGMAKLWALIQNGGPWEQLRRFDKTLHRTPVQRSLEKLAVARAGGIHSLKKHVPSGFTYINVGHGHLNKSLWPRLRKAGVGKVVALVHDVIPIDFPQFTKPRSTKRFLRNFTQLAENADVFIYNSTDTANRTRNWLQKWGIEQITGHVILLGTDQLPVIDTLDTPPSEHPYFVCLSTIEPRKNHRLLLDIWQEFDKTLPADNIPHLHIVGARGWLNEGVIHELNTAPFMGKTVFERGQIPDAELGPLLKGAQALLFPSFTEGFGYPLVEALQMQVPAICSDLPSFREIAADSPTYIDVSDKKLWREAIISQTTQGKFDRDFSVDIAKLPTWSQHFHIIDTIVLDSFSSD